MATAALGLLKGVKGVGGATTLVKGVGGAGIVKGAQGALSGLEGGLVKAQALANEGAKIRGSLNKLGSTVQGIVKGPGGLPSTAMPKVANSGPCTCTHT